MGRESPGQWPSSGVYFAGWAVRYYEGKGLLLTNHTSSVDAAVGLEFWDGSTGWFRLVCAKRETAADLEEKLVEPMCFDSQSTCMWPDGGKTRQQLLLPDAAEALQQLRDPEIGPASAPKNQLAAGRYPVCGYGWALTVDIEGGAIMESPMGSDYWVRFEPNGDISWKGRVLNRANVDGYKYGRQQQQPPSPARPKLSDLKSDEVKVLDPHPDSYTTTLLWSYSTTLDPSGKEGFVHLKVRANDVRDPLGTNGDTNSAQHKHPTDTKSSGKGTGKAPTLAAAVAPDSARGFAEIITRFEHFTVLSARAHVTYTAKTKATEHAPRFAGLIVDDGRVATNETANAVRFVTPKIISDGVATHCVVPSFKLKPHALTQDLDVKSWFAEEVIGVEGYRGSVDASPTKEVCFMAWASNFLDCDDSNPVHVSVRVEYVTIFTGDWAKKAEAEAAAEEAEAKRNVMAARRHKRLNMSPEAKLARASCAKLQKAADAAAEAGRLADEASFTAAQALMEDEEWLLAAQALRDALGSEETVGEEGGGGGEETAVPSGAE